MSQVAVAPGVNPSGFDPSHQVMDRVEMYDRPSSTRNRSYDFHKQPITPALTSPSTVGDSDGLSEYSTSPPPVSLLSLLRQPDTKPVVIARPDKAGSPTPILRRDSISSDAEHNLHFSTLDMSDHHKDPLEPRRALKFNVAAPAHPHPPLRAPTPATPDDSDSDDLGYQEDEEDGEFSDDEDYVNVPPQPSSDYPFARPTNYGSEFSHDAPPAPAILPPPSRRGRGHVRVLDDHAAPKTCSRHCSPPPARSRSGSDAAPGRLSDAGPREGRCGSPMPDVSDLPDVDDEAEEESVEDSPTSNEVPMASRWRRASEHLPGFRQYGMRRPSGEACPPSLDETPIVAGSLSRNDDSVYSRLESSLANDPVGLSRARSVGARVAFTPSGSLEKPSDAIAISRH